MASFSDNIRSVFRPTVWALLALVSWSWAQSANLGVTLTAQTDTVVVAADGTTQNAVAPGSSFRLLVDVRNYSAESAALVQVVLLLPDHVVYLNSSPAASLISGNFVFWYIPVPAGGEGQLLSLEALCKHDIPVQNSVLLAQVQISPGQDVTPDDNTASVIIRVLHPQAPPQYADVGIKIQPTPDSVIVHEGIEYCYLAPGGTLTIAVNVSNLTQAVARDVRVTLNPPEGFDFASFIPPPLHHADGQFIWQIDSLTSFSGTLIMATLKAPPQNFSAGIRALTAQVSAMNDTLSGNNFDSLFVWLDAPPADELYDLAVNLTAIADSTISIDGTLYPASLLWKRFAYRMQVFNRGPGTARDLQVQLQFGNDIRIGEATITPNESAANLLTWRIDQLAVGQEWRAVLLAAAEQSLKPPHLIVTSAVVYGALDISLNDNHQEAFVYIVNPPEQLPDVSLQMTVQADSFQTADGDSIPLIVQGGSCDFRIKVANWSRSDAQALRIGFKCGDSLAVVDARPSPETLRPDSVVWMLNSLPAGHSLIYQCRASLPMRMPLGENQLQAEAWVFAQNEDAGKLQNNSATVRLLNYGVAVPDMMPELMVTPTNARVDDSIRVRVRFSTRVKNWDLWVHLPDGNIDRSYGDAFIASTAVTPGVWYEITPAYQHPVLASGGEQEDLTFEVHAAGYYDNFGSAQSKVTVFGAFEITLPNLLTPNTPTLPIELIIPAGRLQINAYDVSGRWVAKIIDELFPAGKHTIHWNGADDAGRLLGSGTYLLTLHIGTQRLWKKVIIVR